jgi:ribosome silencing factor RsfS/YbeB/iojap
MTYDDGRKSPDSVKDLAMRSLDADKALEIEMIDLRGQSSLADFMIVATGTSSRHVYALADKLAERLSAIGLKDVHIEGQKTSDWVVVDAGDVIIHVFRSEVRSFYAIEKMWRNPNHPNMELVTA